MSRAFVEFFRQPDMQFVSEDNPIGHALHFGTWGLTMGQALSLPMIFAGLALIWWAFRMQKRDPDQKTTETV
jgi:phosphatidylglycerol:prolipoprotein diacylglycerol transferase